MKTLIMTVFVFCMSACVLDPTVDQPEQERGLESSTLQERGLESSVIPNVPICCVECDDGTSACGRAVIMWCGNCCTIGAC